MESDFDLNKKILQGNIKRVERNLSGFPLDALEMTAEYMRSAKRIDDNEVKLKGMAGLVRQAHVSANSIGRAAILKGRERYLLTRQVVDPINNWFGDNAMELNYLEVDIHDNEIDWVREHDQDALVSRIRLDKRQRYPEVVAEVERNYFGFREDTSEKRAATMAAEGVYLVQAARHFPDEKNADKWMGLGLAKYEEADEMLPNPDRKRDLNVWAFWYWTHKRHAEGAITAREQLAESGLGMNEIMRYKMKSILTPFYLRWQLSRISLDEQTISFSELMEG